jgi:hypothetical protein
MYLLLDVYSLPRDLHIGAVFAILLTCIQFGSLESGLEKLKEDIFKVDGK